MSRPSTLAEQIAAAQAEVATWPQGMLERFLGRAQPVQQPAAPVECGACLGSGRMVRDADIGTDQECFSCGGSGKSEP